MVQGMLHRAGVAIVLMATLLVPYGRCQAPNRTAGHECCMRHAAPAASLKASCCTVRSEIPAIVVERAVPNPNAMMLQPTPVAIAAPAAISMKFVVPPFLEHSPPPGKSVLRS